MLIDIYNQNDEYQLSINVLRTDAKLAAFQLDGLSIIIPIQDKIILKDEQIAAFRNSPYSV